MNQVDFQTENYTSKVLDEYMIDRNFPIKSTDNWIQPFHSRQSFLESDERYLGDGFYPREDEWYELIDDETFNDGWSPESILNFAFQISMDTKQYNR